MTEGTPFAIGAHASCTDGPCGRVTQVVVDPLDRTLTDLIVEPDHRQGLGRLVPVDRVEAASVDSVVLSCTKADFEKFESAEETKFLPGIEGYPGLDPEQMLLWPYFGGNTTFPVTVDTLPVGDVAVRRDDQVHATDGEIGRVKGLVVDSGNHHVSHVLLQEGHLFGRKEVAIPISAVTAVADDGIRLSLTKHEVAELPAVELDG